MRSLGMKVVLLHHLMFLPTDLHPACNLHHHLHYPRIWPKQINMHLQIQLAVLKLPKEHLIANYTVSPFYQIAKKQ